jgi:NAD(P)-dependent dehydrogenase (short-subunit alcohol dehydrogenase family)
MNETNESSFDLTAYTPAPGLLQGKNILITGAGDGIGRALALGCASYGATVILLGRTVSKLEAIYDEIENCGYPQAAIYPLDLEKAPNEAFDQLGEVLQENFQQLDGLIHNAAILGPHTPMLLTEPQIWQRVMQVNLTAPYLITRNCYPLLKAADSAALIFTSDAVARHGRAYWGPYAVTKAGLENLMQILADEWENTTTIRVNAIDPGPARTLLRRLAFPGENPNSLATPEDCVLPYLYLLDSQPSVIRGQSLRWDSQSHSLAKL